MAYADKTVGVSTWLTASEAAWLDHIVIYDRAASRSDWLRQVILDHIACLKDDAAPIADSSVAKNKEA